MAQSLPAATVAVFPFLPLILQSPLPDFTYAHMTINIIKPLLGIVKAVPVMGQYV
jgi:hypothetical protein